MRGKHLAIVLILLVLALPAAPAHAGGVVSTCDETHLKAALTGGGTVTFSCSGTITLTSTLAIAADTTIDGSGQNVVISGGGAVGVFVVNPGVTLNLNKLTVADGKADSGGGILNDGGTVTVSNSTFSDNSARYIPYGGEGGGICNNNSGTVTVSNSTFSGNSAGGGGGILNISGTVTVSNSIFSYNSAHYGGGIDNLGTLTVSNSTFSGNSVDGSPKFGHGGGILNDGTVTVSNSTFSGNSAYLAGGGIENNVGGTMTVSNSTFSGNSARYEGGGIRNNGSLTVSNSTFSGNSAYLAGGGGISNIGSGIATLKNTLVANSPAGGNCYGTINDGGGNLSYGDATCPGINGDPKLGPLQDNGGPTQTMALGAGSAARDAAVDAICAAPPVNNLDQRGVTRPRGAHCDIGAYETTTCTVTSAADDGTTAGTLRVLLANAGCATIDFNNNYTVDLNSTLGTLTIDRDVTIDGAGHTVVISGGGAVGVFFVNSGGTLNLNKLTIADGMADDYGGGIYNSYGTVTVSNSTFSGNSAALNGGGISNWHGTVTVSNSTFSGNSAAGGGGGIVNDGGTVTVSNSTFSGNDAAYGGGIDNAGGLTVSNSTFSGNGAFSGGGIYNYVGTATLQNTLVANSPTGGNCGGTITDGGGNLSYGDTTCPGINGDPKLGPLQANGGPTQTMALGAGSAALDAANDAICAAPPVNNLDQRGVARPQGPHCDIGAYEAKRTVYLPLIRR